jgi:hypothetical protein
MSVCARNTRTGAHAHIYSHAFNICPTSTLSYYEQDTCVFAVHANAYFSENKTSSSAKYIIIKKIKVTTKIDVQCTEKPSANIHRSLIRNVGGVAFTRNFCEIREVPRATTLPKIPITRASTHQHLALCQVSSKSVVKCRRSCVDKKLWTDEQTRQTDRRHYDDYTLQANFAPGVKKHTPTCTSRACGKEGNCI